MTTRPSEAYYLPQLDVLRFWAFLLVFVHHAFPNFPSGYAGPRALAWLAALTMRAGAFGVDLFFVLSAFLITELLVREASLFGSVHVKSFYIRRALRIWPLYFTFLVGGHVLAWIWPFLPKLAPPALAAFLLFVGNWWIVFHGNPEMTYAPLWSVCIEEQFYLLWPLAVARLATAGLKKAAVAMIVSSLIVRGVLVAAGAPEHAIWSGTFSRMDPIALGVLLALGARPTLGRWQLDVAAGGAGILLAQALSDFRPFFLRVQLVPSYLIAAASCALILSGAIRARPSQAPWMKLLVYLGKISFGLYIFHYPVLMATQALLPFKTPVLQVLREGIALLATMVAATLSYELLEKPFLRLKQRFTYVRNRDA